MKTKITLAFFASLLALFCVNYNNVSANAGGSPGGRSSSGGDSGNSCGQGGCHGGGHTTQSGIITTNIPSSGYVPGTTYTVGVAGTSGSGTKFGFELAAENSMNATAGTLAASSAREQVLANGHGTHTSTGNTGTSGSFGWSFNWTAPAAGTGNVKLSTAVLVANNNGTNSGDNTIVFNTTISENTSTTSVSELNATNTRLFPNPVVDYLNIQSQILSVYHVKVMNVEGKIVFDSPVFPIDKIDLSSLEKGIYFVVIKNDNSQFTQRIMKI